MIEQHERTEAQRQRSIMVYWNGGATPKERLRTWKMSKTSEDERECRNCEETFDIDEFWTGTILSFYCNKCRPKTKKRRKGMERQIAAENRTKRQKKKDEKAEGSSAESKGGGSNPLRKLAGKAAGKMVEKAIS